jgi:4-hydroxyphenylpyruvate dioxygenase
MVLTEEQIALTHSEDSLQLNGFDYVELYVGNASQAAHFYQAAFGFQPIAYAGLETGEHSHVTYVMAQGEIRLLLTAPITPESSVSEHLRLHGESVKDIAFTVKDAARAFDMAVKRGARPVMEPSVFENEAGRFVKSTVAAFGDTVHSFVEREGKLEAFFPHFLPIENASPVASSGLSEIDHVAISVEADTLERWIDFYKETLGFSQSHQENITTNLSAMHSKVMQSSMGRIKFPIMEPAPGQRKSQIEEYLAFHRGAGVQHLAFRSSDIVRTVSALRRNSIQFLGTPDAYYSMLQERVGTLGESVESLRELGILVDRDEWGYLLQIFTKSLQSRPTLFIEVIQRSGARGFGAGNIKALFEAVEREQAMRGNL